MGDGDGAEDDVGDVELLAGDGVSLSVGNGSSRNASGCGVGGDVGTGAELSHPTASARSKTIRTVAIAATFSRYYACHAPGTGISLSKLIIHSGLPGHQALYSSAENIMSAIETWGEMVRVEHAQSDRMRGVRPTDTWAQFAAQFKADPHRTDDRTVEALRSRLLPGESLLDVGAGGGRLALPLALTCRTVTAVEPSPSMCAVLRETALEYNIENVSIVESRWLDATVEPADVALCSHVVYVVEDIGPFVRKMDDHARRLVLSILFQSPPPSQISGIWEQVHGEKRHGLPCLPEFLPVLEELGMRPEVTELDEQPPRGFDSLEEAKESIARRLFVTPGTAAMSRLERALESWLREEDSVWQIEGAQPLRPYVVAWETAGR